MGSLQLLCGYLEPVNSSNRKFPFSPTATDSYIIADLWRSSSYGTWWSHDIYFLSKAPSFFSKLYRASHIAETVARLGPLPLALLENVRRCTLIYWQKWQVTRHNCLSSATESIARLFYLTSVSSTGRFLAADRILHNSALQSSSLSLSGQEWRESLPFTRRMLCWMPKERDTTVKLLAHLFLRMA